MKPLSKLTSQRKKTASGEFSHEIGDQLAIGRLWFIRIFQIGKHHLQKPSPVNEDEGEMFATVQGREVREYESDILHKIRRRVKRNGEIWFERKYRDIPCKNSWQDIFQSD